MAISEPEIPSTQHFQVCDNEECKKIVYFTAICVIKQCSNEAEKIISRVWNLRIMKLSLSNNAYDTLCKKNARFIHPKNWIYFVRNAIHIYTKCCTLQDHQRHTFVDFEAIYTDNSEKCQQKIFNISQYLLPDSQILQE